MTSGGSLFLLWNLFFMCVGGSLTLNQEAVGTEATRERTVVLCVPPVGRLGLQGLDFVLP